jgi:hypothetical protein
LSKKQEELAGLETRLSNLQDSQQPHYHNDVTPDWHHYGIKVYDGMQTVPNRERPEIQAKMASDEKIVGSSKQTLAVIDAKIADVQSQLPKAEQDYQDFLDAPKRLADEKERQEREVVAKGNRVQASISIIATVLQIANRNSYDWDAPLTVSVNSRYKYNVPQRYQLVKSGEVITVDLAKCTDNAENKLDPSTTRVASVTVSLAGHDSIAIDVKP